MSRIKRIAILAVLAIGTYILMSSIYTVSEVEQAIITQFGMPIGAPVTDAGLKFKVPFIQDVNLIDKRVLEWDGNPSDMPTKDKLYVSVDLFARWRIIDPLQYFLRLHLMQINHRLDHAGHASVGRQNLRSTTERPLSCVRKM
jgi:modulator of FtsH protease HflC